jgi:hypothetical protein
MISLLKMEEKIERVGKTMLDLIGPYGDDQPAIDTQYVDPEILYSCQKDINEMKESLTLCHIFNKSLVEKLEAKRCEKEAELLAFHNKMHKLIDGISSCYQEGPIRQTKIAEILTSIRKTLFHKESEWEVYKKQYTQMYDSQNNRIDFITKQVEFYETKMVVLNKRVEYIENLIGRCRKEMNTIFFLKKCNELKHLTNYIEYSLPFRTELDAMNITVDQQLKYKRVNYQSQLYSVIFIYVRKHLNRLYQQIQFQLGKISKLIC